jgi:hypothetical protein
MFLLEVVTPEIGITPARWELIYLALQCGVFSLGCLIGLKL